MRNHLKTALLLIATLWVMFSCKKENSPDLPDSKLKDLKVGYHFDDFTKGNAIDFSGNHLSGTPYELQLVDGKYGKGVLFNKPESKIEFNSLGDFKNGITIDFWIYLNELSGNGYKNIIQERVSFNNLTFQIGIRNDTVCFDFCRNSKIYRGVKSSQPLTTHTWTHLSFNYNGSEIKMYINGVPEDSKSVVMGAVASWNSLIIGFQNYSFQDNRSNTFYGILDEFRIWDHCYSEQEVQSFLMPANSF